MVERWSRIAGYQNYSVSDHGRIRNDKTGRIRKFGKSKGYNNVSLSQDGVIRAFTVHKLVAQAFVGQPQPGQQIRHLDGDMFNNHYSNLAWGTAQDNANDRERHGTTCRGEGSGMAKLTEETVRLIKSLWQMGYGQTNIGYLVNTGKERIHEIVSGKTWKHVSHSKPTD